MSGPRFFAVAVIEVVAMSALSLLAASAVPTPDDRTATSAVGATGQASGRVGSTGGLR